VTYKLFVKDIQFNGIDAFKPVSLMVSSPMAIVVPAELPVKSLAEFIGYVKTKPGNYNYGTFAFSPYDLDMVRFAQMTGISMTPINYNGSSQAYAALLRNDIQMFFGQPSMSAGYVAEGKMKVLAIGSTGRDSQRPTIPTFKESGFDFEIGAWYGLFAPVGTPDDVVTKIASDVSALMKGEALKSKMTELGFDTVASTPTQFQVRVAKERLEYEEAARRIGVEPK
jgi:tripartite-type tricarboxylate transporter receptor subunit TctC